MAKYAGIPKENDAAVQDQMHGAATLLTCDWNGLISAALTALLHRFRDARGLKSGQSSWQGRQNRAALVNISMQAASIAASEFLAH